MVLWEAPVVMVGRTWPRSNGGCAPVSWCAHAGVCLLRGVTRGRGRCVGSALLRPRRARCVACLVTHVLLAVSCLLRRADGVEVIGAALRMKAPVSGIGRSRRGWDGRRRRCAAGCAPSPGTPRRCGRCSPALLVELDRLAGAAASRPSVFADAVEVIGACAAAARRRLGVIGAVSAWQLASALTGGRLLAPAAPAEWINTSRPLGAAG